MDKQEFDFIAEYLRSIDASLRELLNLSKTKRAATPAPAQVARPTAAAPTRPFTPRPVTLNGKYDDPIIKAKDPRDWTGPTMMGCHFSECPAAYLRLLADRYDYFARTATDAKKAGYNQQDAARARAWAERIDAGYTPPATAQDAMVTESELKW